MRLALTMVREEMGPDAVILAINVPNRVETLTASSAMPVTTIAVVTTDNPFQQARDNDQQSLSAAQARPSKLEVEVERMQNEARQRAQALAASLAEKNRESLTQTVNADQISDQVKQDIKQADQQGSFGQILSQAEEKAEEKLETKLEAGVERELFSQLAATPATETTVPAKDQEIVQMRHELQSMRDLLEQQLSSMAWGQFNAEPLSSWSLEAPKTYMQYR